MISEYLYVAANIFTHIDAQSVKIPHYSGIVWIYFPSFLSFSNVGFSLYVGDR